MIEDPTEFVPMLVELFSEVMHFAVILVIRLHDAVVLEDLKMVPRRVVIDVQPFCELVCVVGRSIEGQNDEGPVIATIRSGDEMPESLLH